jgi:hypothetical protein
MSLPSQSYDEPSIDMSMDVEGGSFVNEANTNQVVSPNELKIEAQGDGDESGGLDSSLDSSGYSGYLYKMTRDGRWQRRWFETNGVFLTYYKSRKREKLLAALSLPQVGLIDLKQYGPNEKKPGTFTIELQSRVYTLRARNDEEAMVWIKILRKLKATKPEDVATTLSPMSMALNEDFRDSTVFDSRGSALSVSSLASASLSVSSTAEGTWEKQPKMRCCPCV